MSIISSVKELKEWGIGSKANYFEFLHMDEMISPDDCRVGRHGYYPKMWFQLWKACAQLYCPNFLLFQRIKYPWQWKWPGLKLSPPPTPQIEKKFLHQFCTLLNNDPLAISWWWVSSCSFWSGHFTQREQMMFHCRALNDSTAVFVQLFSLANREAPATSLSDPPKLNEQNSIGFCLTQWWWKSILATYGAIVSN